MEKRMADFDKYMGNLGKGFPGGTDVVKNYEKTLAFTNDLFKKVKAQNEKFAVSYLLQTKAVLESMSSNIENTVGKIEKDS
jgi:hypothetical protein